MRQIQHFPVIVLGGGTMGSGAAWALARRGVRALVLEQFQHVHALGSHSGQIRIIRHAYAEAPDYVPLVRRADSLWCALEEETEQRFLVRTGGLDLAAPGYLQARRARDSAQQYNLSHEWLDGREVRRRWPAWTVEDDWQACYSPDAGYLLVEPALRSMMTAATRQGVILREQQKVQEWRADGAGVLVRTDDETFSADRLIITAGAWAGGLLAALCLPLSVLRKVVFWLALEDSTPYALGKFPIYIAASDLGTIYGFPLYDGPGVGLRIANHGGGESTNPDDVERTVRDGESEDVLPFAQRYLRGVTSRVLNRAVCMYTVTPDEHFVVDRHPNLPQVVVGAGFSGHGFKFAPTIGEMLAALALDTSARPLPLFAIDRFAGGSQSSGRNG